MTAPGRSATPSVRRHRWLKALALVWLAPLAMYVIQAGGDSTYVGPVLHLAYLFGAVCVPGTLWLLIASRGRRPGWWPGTLASGAVVGLAVELIGWALFTGLGFGRFMVLWPVLVIIAGLLVGGLPRSRWRIVHLLSDPGRRLDRPAPWWLSPAIAVVTTGALYVHYRRQVLPQRLPGDGEFHVYPDLLHHLSMIIEAQRSFPLQTPQVADVPLSYHWFTHAHLAAAADITATDPMLVLLRYWTGPMLIMIAVLIAAVIIRLTGHAWTGPLAAAMVVLGTRVDVWSRGLSGAPFDALSYLSPTQTTASILQLGLLAGLIELFRPRSAGRLGGAAVWLLIGSAALVGAGTKPSVLAPVIVGLVVVAVVRSIARRRWDHRGVLALGVVVAAAVLGMVFAAGSTGGNAIRVVGFVRFAAGYADITRDPNLGAGGLVPAGIATLSSTKAAWLGAALLTVMISLTVPVLCLVGTVVAHKLWKATDDGRWRRSVMIMLTATVGAAVGAFAVVDHPAYAQAYFLATVVPAAVVGVLLLLAGLVDRMQVDRRDSPRRAVPGTEPRRPRVRPSLVAAAVVVVGLSVGLFNQVRLNGDVFGPAELTTGREFAATALFPVLLAGGALCVTAGLAGTFCQWAWIRTPPGIAAALVSVCLGATLTWPTTIPLAAEPIRPATVHAPISAADVAAMRWLAATAAPDDVAVAGTYCIPVMRLQPGETATRCDARGFVVSGLAGRRVLLDGWAYTSESYATQRPGVRYTRLPSPWPDRLELTNRVLSSPDAATVDELRTRGVRWIYADALVEPAALTALDELTVRTYDADGVRWYRIDPAP